MRELIGALISIKGKKFIINRSIETYKLKHHDLAPGVYNFKLNTVLIENVEIKEGQITSLRTGVLEINSDDWELRDKSGEKFLTSGNQPTKIVLPNGSYLLEKGGSNQSVNDPEDDSGRVSLRFGPDGIWSLSTSYASFGITNQPTEQNPDPSLPAFIKLYPGIYNMKLSNVRIPSVPVYSNKETRLKFGYLNIISNGQLRDWSLLDFEQHELNEALIKDKGPKKLVLPPDFYILKWSEGSFFIKVEEGKTTDFKMGAGN